MFVKYIVCLIEISLILLQAVQQTSAIRLPVFHKAGYIAIGQSVITPLICEFMNDQLLLPVGIMLSKTELAVRYPVIF